MDIVKIGYFIRECRKNKNLTQKQLADKLYVEPKTISKWETGKGLPDVSIMKNLCNELGISLSELFIGDYIKEESNDLLIEKLIIDELKKEKIQNKKKLIGEILIGCAFIGSVITLILLVGDCFYCYIFKNYINCIIIHFYFCRFIWISTFRCEYWIF